MKKQQLTDRKQKWILGKYLNYINSQQVVGQVMKMFALVEGYLWLDSDFMDSLFYQPGGWSAYLIK